MKRGFTLMELLMVLAILGLIATIAVSSLSGLNSRQALNKNATLLTSLLNQARSMTLGAQNDSSYGVHLESSRAVLFSGEIYSSGASTNISFELDGTVTLSAINLTGGGSEIVFKRLTGKTEQPGTFQVSLNADPTIFKTITIYQSGLSEIN